MKSKLILGIVFGILFLGVVSAGWLNDIFGGGDDVAYSPTNTKDITAKIPTSTGCSKTQGLNTLFVNTITHQYCGGKNEDLLIQSLSYGVNIFGARGIGLRSQEGGDISIRSGRNINIDTGEGMNDGIFVESGGKIGEGWTFVINNEDVFISGGVLGKQTNYTNAYACFDPENGKIFAQMKPCV